jgi:hypothetical protein
MIRSTALVPLSREHHEALVLARRACEPLRPGAEPAVLRDRLLQRWPRVFEPHFAVEEEVLLPALAAAGAADIAASGRAQHDHLRSLVARLRSGELAVLPAWGEAMRSHVRWEERELFPRAQALLDLPRLEQALQRPFEVATP